MRNDLSDIADGVIKMMTPAVLAGDGSPAQFCLRRCGPRMLRRFSRRIIAITSCRANRVGQALGVVTPIYPLAKTTCHSCGPTQVGGIASLLRWASPKRQPNHGCSPIRLAHSGRRTVLRKGRFSPRPRTKTATRRVLGTRLSSWCMIAPRCRLHRWLMFELVTTHGESEQTRWSPRPDQRFDSCVSSLLFASPISSGACNRPRASS